MDLYFLFFRKFLLSNRAGSVIRVMARLCWVATTIGVTSLIVIQSIMNGFNESIQNKLLGVDAHVTVYTEDSETRIKQLLEPQIPVNEIRTFSQQDVILRTLDGQFSGVEALGFSESGIGQFLSRLSLAKSKKAEIPNQEVAVVGERELLVGISLARSINLFEGDEVLLMSPESLLLPAGEAPQPERFRVRGFLNTDTDEHDSRLVVFKSGSEPYRFQARSAIRHGVDLILKNVSQADAAKKLLQSEFSVVETWKDKNSAMFFALRVEKAAMQGVLSLAILITSFSLITVVTMLLAQKRKEIGLMMALGLSDKRLRRLFLNVGLFLSGFGLVLGLGFGIGISVFLEKYPLDVMPDIYYDSVLPSRVDFQMISQIAIFIGVIAFLAAYLPIRSYMKRTASENLRRA